MSLRLKKLSSSPEAFDPIVFTDGVNLVLGERAGKGTGPQKNKVNGVGKSVFVDFLHFALCRGYQDTRVSRIPPGTLPPDLVVVLDLEIHGSPYQIRRAIATPGQVTVIAEEEASSRTFPNIDEANHFLGDLLFIGQPLAGQTSFRQLLSLMMRDEERERVAAIEEALVQLKTDPAFKAVEGRLIEIEAELLKLRAERKQLAWQIEQIRIVPRGERVDTTDIKIVYDRIQTGLGELVKKSLEQAMAFKMEIERFQQSLVKEELEHLETRHREVQKRISGALVPMQGVAASRSSNTFATESQNESSLQIESCSFKLQE